MAEYCIDCWNRLNGTHYTEKDVKTDMDLCEGCGKWKPVVVVIHRRGIRGWLERRQGWPTGCSARAAGCCCCRFWSG